MLNYFTFLINNYFPGPASGSTGDPNQSSPKNESNPTTYYY